MTDLKVMAVEVEHEIAALISKLTQKYSDIPPSYIEDGIVIAIRYHMAVYRASQNCPTLKDLELLSEYARFPKRSLD